MNTPTPTATPYELIGGEDAVKNLVHRFYELMDHLPEAHGIRQLHPESLAGSEAMLFEYLSGWLGGPNLYIAKKGHPRLRMRHAPYAIGQQERDAWMLCMTQALTEQVEDVPFRNALIQQFSELATHMINV
jgi:hemoglobin